MGVTRRSTRRSVERFETAQPGSVTVGGRRYTCTVRNLSEAGSLISGNFEAEAGDMMELDVAWVGALPGRIAWRDGDAFGVVFTGQATAGTGLAHTLHEMKLPCVSDRRASDAA